MKKYTGTLLCIIKRRELNANKEWLHFTVLLNSEQILIILSRNNPGISIFMAYLLDFWTVDKTTIKIIFNQRRCDKSQPSSLKF